MIAQREPIAPIQEEYTLLDELSCPVCHRNDRIDKVSSLVRRETGQVIAVGSGGVFAFHTALSKTLAPPEQPHTESWTQRARQIGVAWALLAAVVAIVLLSPLQNVVNPPSDLVTLVLVVAIGWFGVAGPAWSAWRLYTDKQAAERALPLWVQARERWSMLYYCSRDDVVFVANEERSESPDQLLDLLYRREVATLVR
jgi:hypothetical protein